MANEAVMIFETAPALPFIVADNVGIEMGAALKLVDPMTASGSFTLNDPVAGIAATEKIADNGTTRLGVYRGGIFKMTASGSITAGDEVILASGSNSVMTAPIPIIFSGMNVLGTALETATNGETLRIELNPHRVIHS